MGKYLEGRAGWLRNTLLSDVKSRSRQVKIHRTALGLVDRDESLHRSRECVRQHSSRRLKGSTTIAERDGVGGGALAELVEDRNVRKLQERRRSWGERRRQWQHQHRFGDGGSGPARHAGALAPSQQRFGQRAGKRSTSIRQAQARLPVPASWFGCNSPRLCRADRSPPAIENKAARHLNRTVRPEPAGSRVWGSVEGEAAL